MTSSSPRRRPRSWLAALVAAGCVTGGLALVPASAPAAPAAASAKPTAQAHPLVTAFASDSRTTGAMFRWWWPSTVEPDVAVRQLRQVKDAGYKGVEIAFVMDGTNYVVDADKHEYGDANWRAAVQAVLTEANRLGLHVDLTLGGRWPAGVPGLDVSSNAASQELITGDATVEAAQTFDAEAPAPPQLTYADRTMGNGVVTTTTKVSQPSLVSASAARCVSACTSANPQLDLNSVVDLSDSLTDGHLTWTAPDAGTWVVTAYWQRGTAQRNDAPFGTSTSPLSDPETRVVNHFSAAGASAITGFMDSLLNTRTRQLLRANGGSIFEDSLELRASQLWTPEFFDRFQQVNGYSVVPYLPVLARATPPGPFQPSPAVYTFAAGQSEAVERIHVDVEQTLNALYRDNHAKPIRAWANSRGLTYRAQGYGEPIDLGEAAGYLDISECESLGCSEAQFRTASAGVALAGKQVLSSEMLPGGFGNLYGLTPAQVAALANKEYSFGANQMVFHGLPYPTNPPSADGTIVDSSASWPGFHAFSALIGEAFGPRQPTWTMERDISGYYARTQRVLRAGTLKLDVAVLNQTLNGGTPTLDGTALLNSGLSYGYITPGSLRDQQVAGGRLAPEGPAFQGLVVGNEPVDVSTARRIRRLVADGLTVVVIGAGPHRARGYAATAADAEGQDAIVEQIFDDIVASPNGHRATGPADAAEVLQTEGVRADAAVEDGTVKAVHRRTGDVDLYALVNRGAEDVTTTVTLLGRAGNVPYALDPWTGRVAPVGVFTASANRITLDVTIEAGSTELVALAGRRFTGITVPVGHVVSTDAEDATWISGRLTVRADDAGTFTSRLSNGRTLRTAVAGVPKPRQLGDWDLRLDEWLPGGPADASSVTRHEIHEIAGVPLRSWTEIDGIKDAVGVGTYTTRVDASRRLAKVGAVLDLGKVGGSYRVYVNGRLVATPDQLGTLVDLGSRLDEGRNVIQVKVASTLLNRLRVHRPAEFGSRTPTTNGLVGPVTLDPYKVVTD